MQSSRIIVRRSLTSSVQVYAHLEHDASLDLWHIVLTTDNQPSGFHLPGVYTHREDAMAAALNLKLDF